MSAFDESQHDRDAAGKFTEMSGAEQTDTLTAPIPAFTPADVLNTDFTFDSLRAYLGEDRPAEEIDPDEEGRRRLQWTVKAYGSAFDHRATVDDSGEIVKYEDRYVSEEHGVDRWSDADYDDRQLHGLRHQVNVDRLAFAGILVHGLRNDGGAYGRRFTGGRSDEKLYDAAAISKRIREDLKRAQEFGAIPSNLDYRVRTHKYSGGQSINVYAEGVTDEQQYMTDVQDRRVRHPWAAELDKTISVIGEQWQDCESDSMTDYYNYRYYFFVQIPDEHHMRWQQEMREDAAAKRAAKKAAMA